MPPWAFGTSTRRWVVLHRSWLPLFIRRSCCDTRRGWVESEWAGWVVGPTPCSCCWSSCDESWRCRGSSRPAGFNHAGCNPSPPVARARLKHTSVPLHRPLHPPAQVLPTAVLWGVGTALGEVPPYALSYHAAKAGKRSAEVEAMLGVGSAGSGRSGGGKFALALAAMPAGGGVVSSGSRAGSARSGGGERLCLLASSARRPACHRAIVVCADLSAGRCCCCCCCACQLAVPTSGLVTCVRNVLPASPARLLMFY